VESAFRKRSVASSPTAVMAQFKEANAAKPNAHRCEDRFNIYKFIKK